VPNFNSVKNREIYAMLLPHNWKLYWQMVAE